MILYINNQTVSTLEELRTFIKKKEATEIGSPLFNELKELFVDGDLKEFISSLGQLNLADKIGCIGRWETDSKTMRQLIAAITDETPEVDFDITNYLELVKADIVGEEAVMQVKVLKQACEEVEFAIRQGDNWKKSILNLGDKKIGSILQLKLIITLGGGDVLFFMNGTKLIAKQTRVVADVEKDEGLSWEQQNRKRLWEAIRHQYKK